MDATILHADLDSFYASVEQRDDARLRGRPVIVGAGVVLAASYEAKAFGVHTPMGLSAARRLCPGAVVLRPRFDAYVEASRRVFDVFHDLCPIVDALSIDEAFLDVRGLERIHGRPETIAATLRRRVRAEVGLPITVGVARTRFLAKVASAVAKPDGLLVVPAGGELAFLHPLPVERLWGVGPKTTERLHARGLRTVGHVARLPEQSLVAMLGPGTGRHLHALAHDRDPRRFRTGVRRGSVGAQRALGRRGPRTADAIEPTLAGLVDRVTERLRRAGRVGRTVVLRLRFGDFARATRSTTLARPTHETHAILVAARALLARSMPDVERRGLTLVGVAVTGLEDADAVQLVLPLDPHGDGELDAALDEVRARFGPGAVQRAALLGRERGWEPPMPDPDGGPPRAGRGWTPGADGSGSRPGR